MTDPHPPQAGTEDTASGLGAIAPRSMQMALRGVATVVAPTSLVTALLYYFGWARTSNQAAVMGLDDSLLGYSTQDYLLRSMSSMYLPLFVGLLVGLVGLALHGSLVAWAGRPGPGDPPEPDPQRRLVVRRLALGLAGAGVVSLMLGIAGSLVDRPVRIVSIASPLGVTASIVLLSYAAHLWRRFGAPGRRAVDVPELRSLRLLAASLVVLLLFLSLFWSVSHYAGVKGVDLALQVERELPRRPDVTVFSAKRLHLRPPVVERELPGPESAYRFEYSGLKLLFRSERKFFLRPSDPSASHVNIVIPESPELRLEFVRP